MTTAERIFRAALTQAGLPQPMAEHRFAAPRRRWRFDYSWAAERVALEVDGGIWTRGRHVRGRGALGDMEKLNEAAILGWRVLRVTPRQLPQQATMQLLRRALEAVPPEGKRL